MTRDKDNTDETPSEGDEEQVAEADGGATVDYLDTEINIFKPATPFMRDHLRLLWISFALWLLFVFGPVTATYLAPETMTSVTVMGFQLHYFLTAIGAPSGALLLSILYAYRRDKLDDKYGIDHSGGEG